MGRTKSQAWQTVVTQWGRNINACLEGSMLAWTHYDNGTGASATVVSLIRTEENSPTISPAILCVAKSKEGNVVYALLIVLEGKISEWHGVGNIYGTKAGPQKGCVRQA